MIDHFLDVFAQELPAALEVGASLKASSCVFAVLPYAHVKIPLSGSVAGFAGDIGAVLTRQDISTNLQCGTIGRGRKG